MLTGKNTYFAAHLIPGSCRLLLLKCKRSDYNRFLDIVVNYNEYFLPKNCCREGAFTRTVSVKFHHCAIGNGPFDRQTNELSPFTQRKFDGDGHRTCKRVLAQSLHSAHKRTMML